MASQSHSHSQPISKNTIGSYLELPKTPAFPDMAQNYVNTVVVPQQQAQAALEAQEAPPPPAAPPPPPPAEVVVTDALTGSEGYSLPYGNCVDEPGVNNPFDGSNPISWSITSSVPWVGASALFYFNHVAIVSGIWSNGDVEIRQRNCPGCDHRFPLSYFRGFR